MKKKIVNVECVKPIYAAPWVYRVGKEILVEIDTLEGCMVLGYYGA
jgi:hypothetical protein